MRSTYLEPDEIPRHIKRASQKRKRFGIEHYSRWFKRWGIWQWYLIKKQRDQALAMLLKHTSTWFKERYGNEPHYRKVERK